MRKRNWIQVAPAATARESDPKLVIFDTEHRYSICSNPRLPCDWPILPTSLGSNDLKYKGKTDWSRPGERGRTASSMLASRKSSSMRSARWSGYCEAGMLFQRPSNASTSACAFQRPPKLKEDI